MDIKFSTQIIDVSVALKALQQYRDGEYKQAIETLLVILETEPNNWDARLMLAASYFGTSQFAAAERSFQTVLDKCPVDELREKARAGVESSLAQLTGNRSAQSQ
ncbi:MAG TPA: tetratricopeptide repeat protein [Candidatus Obscuribacterales bacterium]